jgi:chromosome segregation ATPase
MALSPEQVNEINQAAILDATTNRLKEVEADLKSAKDALGLKCQRVTSLEAEIARLWMTRSDDAARAEAEKLRQEVSSKDKEIANLKKALAAREDNERSSLFRAQEAERKAEGFKASFETMQHARDAAISRAANAEQERLEAVRKGVEASDTARRTEAKFKNLEAIREQADRVLRALPPGLQNQKEPRALAALLNPPKETKKK